ncbi:MAG TPA: HAMP domain-containing sensor histidine kinase [Gemmatimonadaceae bacterium]|nr:HAMP domain-containing sensor histidine kinase [Gemmatimonadaceae bacterium]
MRRGAPVIIVAAILALLLGSYVVYTRTVVLRLRQDAGRLGQMYARVFHALADTSADAGNAALLDLSRHIVSLGVPVIITDTAGHPTATANLPFEAPLGDPRVAAYVAILDAENEPVTERGVGQVHYGDSRLVQSLRYIPVIQAMLLLVTLVAGVYVLRTRSRADRERVWAGMARESAHQLGTPLSSLSGWLELLAERGEDPVTGTAVRHMEGDLERLERVAHRFERIGRPPRRDRVDACELVERVGAYFRARVPTLAHRVTISTRCSGGSTVVLGDAVLLEWALEALAKNAIDALSGRGGTLKLVAKRVDARHIRVRVSDDGPGIPRELRSRIFEPGFSTKESGWGIGLSLAKRIVEENHGGRLVLVPTDRGATFDVILDG